MPEDSPPIPDPTTLTTEQLVRAVQAERDYVDGQIAILVERLSAIDRATKLLNDTVNRVPTDVTKEVTHLRELIEGLFEGVALQFRERDTRSEREARDNTKAVDAAFAAQKEAASKQDESNAKAIDKSEVATAEKIAKLAELLDAKTAALQGKIEDNKERIGRIENVNATGRQIVSEGFQTRQEHRQGVNASTQIVGAVIALIAILVTLYLATQNGNTPAATDLIPIVKGELT